MRNVWQADSAGGSAGASAGVPAGSSVGGSVDLEDQQGFVRAGHHVPRHARPGMELDYEDGLDDEDEVDSGMAGSPVAGAADVASADEAGEILADEFAQAMQ